MNVERFISLAEKGTTRPVRNYTRHTRNRKKVLYLFCQLQVKTIGRVYQREVERDLSMSLKRLQMLRRYILMDPTLLVICKATAGDSVPPGSGVVCGIC